MAASFFFYDLETSGINYRTARVMQFAGQRTDLDLKPLGEPVNILIRLTPDIVPEPEAILLTGITPQMTLADGVSEAEFLRYFYDEVVKPETIFLGFNSVRFDDEFMRFLHFRNFYDPYEWQWCDGCSRWDLLDLVRMTRALRPEGIEWPVTADGKAANRLELLTSANGLEHKNAHDALGDVNASIALARFIRDKQPDLFNHLLKSRSKQAVKALVDGGQPFVYTSGRYPAETHKTTAAVLLEKHPEQDCAYVYDLRHDPTPFMAMTDAELLEASRYRRDSDALQLPVKVLKYNRCPAVAPLGVMNNQATQERLQLTVETVQRHLKILRSSTAFGERVVAVLGKVEQQRNAELKTVIDSEHVDGSLYDGFVDKRDVGVMRAIRVAEPAEISALGDDLHDARLKLLLPLYKARNFPQNLSDDERAEWDKLLHTRLMSGGDNSALANYFKRLGELAATTKDSDKQFLLEELQLYGESIMPEPEL